MKKQANLSQIFPKASFAFCFCFLTFKLGSKPGFHPLCTDYLELLNYEKQEITSGRCQGLIVKHTEVLSHVGKVGH